LSITPVEAQVANYMCGEAVYALAKEGENLWVGTNGGLMKLHRSTGGLTFYTIDNSGLVSNSITSIAVDKAGNKWIGTHGGLCFYDDQDWLVFNESNSILTNESIGEVAVDDSNKKYIYAGNYLYKVEDENWEKIFISITTSMPG